MSRASRKRQFCGDGAFTLVEMLVVISIIAVLASLILPATVMVREAARRLLCSNNLHNLFLAVQQFETSHGHLPASRTFWNCAAAWVASVHTTFAPSARYSSPSDLVRATTTEVAMGVSPANGVPFRTT